VYQSNKATNGDVLNRMSRLFGYIFVDEVQDLAGFDLELLKLLFKTDSTVILVGDPRQVTYLTHHSTKYKKYSNGNIRAFVAEQLGKRITCAIDENTLKSSHRNSQAICDFSSKLYPELPASMTCTCAGCRTQPTDHEGLFWIAKEDVDKYLARFQPTQLRWDSRAECNMQFSVMNFGEAKGLSFDRVLIYPTDDMKHWIENHNHALKNETRAKLYVAITRARRSVAFVLDSGNTNGFEDITRYKEQKS
jgi:DNA helicase-2/ATP-dependent DNA helicase PcrA